MLASVISKRCSRVPEQYSEEAAGDEQELTEDGGWSPVQQVQDPSLTRWQLSPEDILEYVEHEMKGEDWSYDKRRWIKKGDAIFNEKGIRAIMTMMRHHINKVVFLSSLEDEHIYEIVYTLSNDLTQLLFNNGDDFALDWDKGWQNAVIDNLCTIVFISLRKAHAQGERKFLGSHTKIMHRIDEGAQGRREKKGLF